MSGEESTHQLLLKLFQKLDELEKRYMELSQRLATLEPLKGMGEDVVSLKQQVAALESIANTGRPRSLKEKESITINDLLDLSDTLRQTYLAPTQAGGEAHPNDVASITGRTRGLESNNLNELHGLGLAQKTRKGREYYFKATPLAKRQN